MGSKICETYAWVGYPILLVEFSGGLRSRCPAEINTFPALGYTDLTSLEQIPPDKVLKFQSELNSQALELLI